MESILIIRNLAGRIDSSDLEGLFGMVGNVVSASVADDLGRVEMSTSQEAADCIERFHGMATNGVILSVTTDRPHTPKPVPFPRAHAKASGKKSAKKVGTRSARK